MKIVIGSGKGGTGKTTVATSFALSLARKNLAISFADCDVEEPNSQIFLKPEIEKKHSVEVEVPVVDRGACINCGACADFCRFNALAVLPEKVLIFAELCHSCGGCMRVCPEGAIKKKKREVGTIEIGSADGIAYFMGRVNVGEARVTPVIAHLKKLFLGNDIFIIDAPPGTSCPFVETVRGADVCVLVTEPTPFGLNDLKLANSVVDQLGIPQAVVLNKSDLGDDKLEKYCAEKNIPILLKIPHDIEIAKAYSEGKLLIDAKPEYQDLFVKFQKELAKLVKRNRR